MNRYVVAQPVNGFSEDAEKAITENPAYFVRWYTAKSIGLCVALMALAYQFGRNARGRKQ